MIDKFWYCHDNYDKRNKTKFFDRDLVSAS